MVIAGGIYNPAKATCGYTCETCDGCTSTMSPPTPSMGASRSCRRNTHIARGPRAMCRIIQARLFGRRPRHRSLRSRRKEIRSQASRIRSETRSTPFSAQLPSTPVSMGQICGPPPNPACQYPQATPQASATVKPAITSISPNASVAGLKAVVTITGSAFGSSPSVSAGSFPVSIQGTLSNTSITVQIDLTSVTTQSTV